MNIFALFSKKIGLIKQEKNLFLKWKHLRKEKTVLKLGFTYLGKPPEIVLLHWNKLMANYIVHYHKTQKFSLECCRCEFLWVLHWANWNKSMKKQKKP